MKAIVLSKYGSPDVLQLKDVEKPSPKDNELLIKIHASTITAGDTEFRGLKFPFWIAIPLRLYVGILKPRKAVILGQELAGEIEAVGKEVTRFRVGDAVFGSTGFHFGGHAEYTTLPAESDDGVLALKPPNLSYEEAAAIPTGGMEALHFLRLAKLQKGEKLLVFGAGGSIGTFSVQLGKHFGAEVTALDSTEKLEMLRSIGADDVIDYTKEDFSRSGKTYDVIFDTIGKSPYTRTIRALNPNGRYICANPTILKLIRGMFTSATSSKQVILKPAGRKPEDLETLRDFAEAGVIKTIIGRRFPLEQTAEAHRYVETGQKQGHVIITMA